MKEALTFDDVLMVPAFNKYPSRNDERIDTSVKLGNYTFDSPIISANMDTITGPRMAAVMDQLGGLGILHRFCSIEENVKMYQEAQKFFWYDVPHNVIMGVSVGVNEGLARAKALYDVGARIFCVDVAHGHSKACGHMVRDLRKEFGSEILIIAGNVCTYAGCDCLIGYGADAIKVGIGPGSACTTRIKTGMGVPQFTAIQDCSRASVPIIADGGIRTPGDVCKALAAGATMVMLGGMLAGTDETPGEKRLVGPPEVMIKVFRGMASKEANEDQFGVMADWKTAEGVSTMVPCKGPIEEVVKDIMGGLRSSMTYNGSATLEEYRRRVEFVRITPASRIESGAHIK